MQKMEGWPLSTAEMSHQFPGLGLTWECTLISLLSKNDQFGLQTIIEDESPDLVFGVYQPIKIRDDYPCLITSVPKDYRKIGNGYIFQKDWPYKDLINFHLLKMYEEGIINSLSNKWLRENSEASCSALVSNFYSS